MGMFGCRKLCVTVLRPDILEDGGRVCVQLNCPAGTRKTGCSREVEATPSVSFGETVVNAGLIRFTSGSRLGSTHSFEGVVVKGLQPNMAVNRNDELLHTFRNHLTAVLGFCDLVLDEVSDDRLREDIIAIKNAAKAAFDLLPQLAGGQEL